MERLPNNVKPQQDHVKFIQWQIQPWKPVVFSGQL